MAANEQPIGLANVLKPTLTWAIKLAPVTSQFPISTAGEKPAIDLRSAAYHALGLELDLLELSRFQIPSALSEQIAVGLPLTVKSSARLRALAQSITLEDQNSNSEKRAWTWIGAEAMFDAHVRPEMSDATRCDWVDLIEGEHIHELDGWLHTLIRLALDLLQSPPLQPATLIRRQGSAHEEHVYGARTWCAICGWLDMVMVPTENSTLYHGGITGALREVRHQLRQLGFDELSNGPKN